MSKLTFNECMSHYLSEKEQGRDSFFKVDWLSSYIVHPSAEYIVRAWKPLISSFKDEIGNDVYLYLDCDVLAVYPSSKADKFIQINEISCTEASINIADPSDVVLYIGSGTVTKKGISYLKGERS